jgi:hypothetical protein
MDESFSKSLCETLESALLLAEQTVIQRQAEAYEAELILYNMHIQILCLRGEEMKWL